MIKGYPQLQNFTNALVSTSLTNSPNNYNVFRLTPELMLFCAALREKRKVVVTCLCRQAGLSTG